MLEPQQADLLAKIIENPILDAQSLAAGSTT